MVILYNGVYCVPYPRGPFGVGTVDLCSPGKDGVLFRIFYPTQMSKQSVKDAYKEWAAWYLGYEYCIGASKYVIGNLFHHCLAPLFYWLANGVKIPAIYKATPAAGPFPVVVISHGLAGCRGFFSTISCELASYGFFVAAIEHRDGSACGSFRMDKDGYQNWIPYVGYNDKIKATVRVAEVFDLVNCLHSINAGNFEDTLDSGSFVEYLHGRLSMSKAVILGHSFGSSTAMKVLADSNNIFSTSVLLDPWMVPLRKEVEPVASLISTPLLCISYDSFNTGPNKRALVKFKDNVKTVEKEFYVMKNSDHLHGNDTPHIMSSWAWRLLSVSSQAPLDVVYPLQTNMILHFLHKHIEFPYVESEEHRKFTEEHKDLLTPLAMD